MRKILLALVLGSLLAPTGHVAQAADEPDCAGWAALQALPYLQQSQQLTALTVSPPGAYGPSPAWIPLVQPWGSGPAGIGALYGPTNVASWGPLGPGVTANYLSLQQQLQASNAAAGTAVGTAAAGMGVAGILAGGLGPGGPLNLTGRPVLNPNDAALSSPGGNASSAISLGFLRQAEIARVLQRYQIGAMYEMAAAARGLEYAVQAQQVYNTLKQDCEDQLATARLAAGSAAASAAAPGATAAAAASAPGTTPATGPTATSATGTGPAASAAAAGSTGSGTTTGTTAAGPSGTTVTTGTMPSPTSTGATAPQP
jgi:hypothetical protein